MPSHLAAKVQEISGGISRSLSSTLKYFAPPTAVL